MLQKLVIAFLLLQAYEILCYRQTIDDDTNPFEYRSGLQDSDNDEEIFEYRRSFLNKCINDKDCKTTEYCDHKWPNPIGSCKAGTLNGDQCILDRHCSSKVCHLFKCVARRPVKDGPCNVHDECIPEQYCSEAKCKDRRCSGWCSKNYECLSNNCHLLRCKRTDACKTRREDFDLY